MQALFLLQGLSKVLTERVLGCFMPMAVLRVLLLSVGLWSSSALAEDDVDLVAYDPVLQAAEDWLREPSGCR